MSKSIERRPRSVHALRNFLSFTLILLAIEFFDELHYGIETAALPALRADLGLSYAQTGLLLGAPGLIATFIEPVLMLLGDTRRRKSLILGGGLTIAGAALGLSAAGSFPAALLALGVAFPASGAFVTLSQGTLMEQNPGREAQMMARWTVFGSAGNLAGPILLAALYGLGLTWRSAYVAVAGLALMLVLLALPHPFGARATGQNGEDASLKPAGLRPGAVVADIRHALRSPGLLRFLILVDFSDLLLDIYLGFAALYFVDVIGLAPDQLAILMSILMAAGLAADLILIPILERFPGLRLVRISAWVSAGVYVAWLLAPWIWAKIALAVLLRMTTLGWYEVLQGEAYASLPGRSGMVMAINSVTGLLHAVIIWLVGQAAESFGLPAAMWLLLAGPLALILGTPQKSKSTLAGR